MKVLFKIGKFKVYLETLLSFTAFNLFIVYLCLALFVNLNPFFALSLLFECISLCCFFIDFFGNRKLGGFNERKD